MQSSIKDEIAKLIFPEKKFSDIEGVAFQTDSFENFVYLESQIRMKLTTADCGDISESSRIQGTALIYVVHLSDEDAVGEDVVSDKLFDLYVCYDAETIDSIIGSINTVSRYTEIFRKP